MVIEDMTWRYSAAGSHHKCRQVLHLKGTALPHANGSGRLRAMVWQAGQPDHHPQEQSWDRMLTKSPPRCEACSSAKAVRMARGTMHATAAHASADGQG